MRLPHHALTKLRAASMETQVRTPQMVFMHPQRLVVPLFQRPYVWNQENQWEPLWEDLTRLAERELRGPRERHQPHFLGAVVLQQVPGPTGHMQQRTIIDGQQRLTTLQLLLDALHAELLAIDALPPAMRIEPLVCNAEPFRARPEDRFKVWPTNRDRPAFQAVMGAEPPIDYDATGYAGERMVEAHRYFAQRAREWLAANGEGDRVQRATVIESAARDLLQLVVIDLGVDENAQEIFETLNARGAQLTAADLIKNFVFQRLLESGADVEREYEQRWREFETAFWEREINVGRIRYPRSSLFLNQWLVARTGEEIVAREVFDRFKRFADHDADAPMAKIVEDVHGASRVYRRFIEGASVPGADIDRLSLFAYRTSVLESEVVKPLLLSLLGPGPSAVPEAQFVKSLEVVESWMVRRMLVRGTTKNYNRLVAEIVQQVRKHGRERSGDVIEAYLASQTSGSSYWPDDQEIREELTEQMAYRRLGRGRLRMVLEAIEDHLRGWHGTVQGLAAERASRGKYVIEHVMPRKWMTHWPLGSDVDAADRDRVVHQIGNLTLLTRKLNSKISNGPWLGDDGKRAALTKHDVLLLNRELFKCEGDGWSDAAIRRRTRELIEIVLKIWPVPEGHQSGFGREAPRMRRKLHLSDLINGRALKPGALLHPRRAKFRDHVGTLLGDGSIELDGATFQSPSDAARSLTGLATNGWWFFFVDPASRRSLRDVRSEYLDAISAEVDDDDEGDDDSDDE
jgi:hypothetical protein